MAYEDRFKQSLIVTLAKRAANRCSNPDCGAITSGPTDDPSGSVNVGEAAHIYGAHPGSSRYDASMESADRADITNAIWLCGNCHKLVDDDPSKYPAGLLFEWQRDHERRVAELVGKAGAELRERYERRHLEEFGRLSYLAERLIVEKGGLWEFRLTSEVLRFEMAPILRRWNALKRRHYMKPSARISSADFGQWIHDRMEEIGQIAEALSELTNREFYRAWGEPGVPGDDAEIVSTCRLYAEMCASALAWEESVRFVVVDDVFSEVRDLFVGIAGGFIDEAAKLPIFMRDTFSPDEVSGTFELNLVLSLPDSWVEAVSVALAKATEALIAKSA